MAFTRAEITARYNARHPERRRASWRRSAKKRRAADPRPNRLLVRSWRKKNPAEYRAQQLRHRYGITPEQYDRMLALQGGKCAICGREPKPGRRLHTDHDHGTKRVRGLLCFLCNWRLLGRGRENPEHHEAAARYLRSTFDGRVI